ncbi:MAG: DUF4279 domain-containing protein [Verrucomicrobiia bacterium]
MSQMHQCNYDDSYPACVETFSTLRVFSNDLAPDEIAKILQIEPTKAFRKGDRYCRRRLQHKTNGWFYSTEEFCDSKDTRRHIDMILDALEGKGNLVKKLHQQHCKIDITSYWMSAGQGGPWLMPQQMLKLGRMGIEVWWDVYFADEDPT